MTNPSKIKSILDSKNIIHAQAVPLAVGKHRNSAKQWTRLVEGPFQVVKMFGLALTTVDEGNRILLRLGHIDKPLTLEDFRKFEK